MWIRAARSRHVAASLVVILAVAACTGGDSGSLPSGWRRECLRPTNASLGLPADWRRDASPLPIPADVLDQMSDHERIGAEHFNGLIASNAIRLAAYGDIPHEGEQIEGATLLVFSGSDTSLEEGLRDVSGYFRATARARAEAVAIETPIGDGFVLEYESAEGGTQLFIDIVYVVWSAGLGTLVVDVSGTDFAADADILRAFGTRVASSLLLNCDD